jgi:hypothetical protein
MSIFDRWWNRLRGKDPDPTIGTQIGLVAGGVAVGDAAREGDSMPDYGWSGDHMSGGSDSGSGGDFGGGGFDGGGGGGGDSGGGGF